jgi:methylated-DNA-protein-cysteine methyltransferase related protein
MDDRSRVRGSGIAAVGSFGEQVLSMVARIPYGKVSTYGDIAAMVGHPRGARGVGHVLSRLPTGTSVPWWRVVSHTGALTIPNIGRPIQSMLLQQEGIAIRNGAVDLGRARWVPDASRER